MDIDASSMMAALARLKNIPIAKVVRNAGRDFARAAYKSTPVARVSKSEYYKYKDARTGEWKYLHQSQLQGRGRKSTKGLKKVRIYKGWSKASWLGVFKALGMPMSPSTRLPGAVQGMSHAASMATDYYAEMTIDDAIHFDRFGRNMSSATVDAVARAGYEAAARNITKELDKMLKKNWEGGA
jgi:hypothetical protein